MGLNFAKAAPKVVAQTKSNPNCWAAALECWVAAQQPKTLFTTTLAKGLTQPISRPITRTTSRTAG